MFLIFRITFMCFCCLLKTLLIFQMIILKRIFRNFFFFFGGGGHGLYYSGAQYGRVMGSLNVVMAIKCGFQKTLETS